MAAACRRFGEGGAPFRRNLQLFCPNHNAIKTASKAEYDTRLMAMKYPNGLVEKLTLRDHLLS